MYIDAPVTKLRDNLSAYVRHVSVTGDRVMLTFHGKEACALVPVRDLHALEKVDNNREEFLETRHKARMREFRMLKEGLK